MYHLTGKTKLAYDTRDLVTQKRNALSQGELCTSASAALYNKGQIKMYQLKILAAKDENQEKCKIQNTK